MSKNDRSNFTGVFFRCFQFSSPIKNFYKRLTERKFVDRIL